MKDVENDSSGIRENPPASVVTFEQHELYRQLYDDISDNGVVLQYQDRHALAELAIVTIEIGELRADIAQNGYTLTVSGDRGSTVTKRNPALEVLQKLQPTHIKLLREFKMTPSTRKTSEGVVGGGAGGKSDGFDEV